MQSYLKKGTIKDAYIIFDTKKFEFDKIPYSECHLISQLLFILIFQDPLVHLPEDMVARAYNIFAITFKYAVDILTWEKENELPDLEMM